MHLRKALLQPTNEIKVILERKVGMQAADNVKFGGALGHALGGARPDSIERVGVCTRRIRRTAKRAKLTVRHAYIGGIDVPVHIEVADVSVALLANMVRQPADG